MLSIIYQTEIWALETAGIIHTHTRLSAHGVPLGHKEMPNNISRTAAGAHATFTPVIKSFITFFYDANALRSVTLSFPL